MRIAAWSKLMRERFAGASGRDVLIDALRRQTLVQGERTIAKEIANIAIIREIEPRENLIVQDGADNDIFLILAGSFTVLVNGREWRRRGPGDHVGEMAAIEPSLRRSATVVANEQSVVAQLTQAQFGNLAKLHPQIWQPIAKELSRRLNQRNAQVRPVRHTPELFVMSSSESLPIARAVAASFVTDPVNVTVWTEGVFIPSGYPLDSLDDVLLRSDFGIVIAAGDDLVTSRKRSQLAPRDNITFELGLTIGRLGRKRTFLLEPSTRSVKLASDLLGLTTVPYDWDPSADPTAQLAVATDIVRKRILDLGPS
jgi:predicted nucleotide-binding protein